MADSSQSGGLLGMDPSLLMNLGMGLMAGSRFGSNAGEGLMQGMQNYQGQRAANQDYQIKAYQLQRQKAMNDMLQGLMGGGQGAAPQGGDPSQSQPQPPPQPSGNASSQAPGGMPAQGSAGPSWLTPPDVNNLPIGGMNPRLLQAYGMASGKDPITSASEVRTQQLAIAQQQVAPALAKLDTVIKSAKPSQYVAADPELAQAWASLAPHAGFDPVKDMNDDNLRSALTLGRNQLSAAVGKESLAPINQSQQIPGPLGSQYSRDPLTGEIKQEIAPQAVDNYITPQGARPVTKAEAVAKGYAPYNQWTSAANDMTGPVGALDAALTQGGVNVPGGRSGAQRVATLKNLIAANPGVSPSDIANQVRLGQLDFSGAKRSTAQLAQMSASTDVASKQIEKNFNSLAPLVKQYGLPKLNGWINSLKSNWTPSGDEDSTTAQGYLLAIAGEYAKIRGGGTGAAAPAEGEQKEALKYMQSILTKGGFDGAQTAITTEARNKAASVKEGWQTAAGGLSNKPGSPQHPPDIQDLLKQYGRPGA